MIVVAVSVLIGLTGVAVTRVMIGRVAAGADRDPHVYWLLGALSLIPAWLILFLALLGREPGPRPDLVSAVSWIASTSSGLIGAIATEGSVRRAAAAGDDRPPPASWRLGVLALLPAWSIALVGYAIRMITG